MLHNIYDKYLRLKIIMEMFRLYPKFNNNWVVAV